ncbi:NUDIX hydrolase OS=Tsukamurella paurometabola (strain ATCC 8368 / DSM / CCUG 35730 / CIP 100753/ JCM 10117 / KCTC 9821 / NBRC 16120 / NCIMB 702349 / NCTC 13040) OX=521096 GN=Tpau_1924 PE=3 SV=1 [Tsukamurella paurometabola]|uniref:NUDIX hydrolase n=1 Tax=Tsukamurella paurometabola (strain ATCC 8368 / DSM 20162 / CCUG 35730 / CIP 100753 / JCM 10117 / KCTC 9821 / NBRC 16120 / NCIMB 702349 / NCTC 13040) TaxID=521096 RepID=D5UN40_TSUPD|nr:NUDIX hydrolase [Tsukamurella paurometabola DSM 20162]SUP32084.1 Nucleoside triphosphatase nudI [Tsukamurella paurometabola]
MLNLTATTVLVIGLIVAAVLIVAVLAYQTAHRLDRLHVRTDLSYQALESALARRAVVARAVAASIPVEQGRALRLIADRAENADRDNREVRENQLSAAIGAIDVETLPRSLVAEIADADTRVTMARRFHNDAVRDTRALRGRRFVRWLHLGGTAPMPRYFDIVDRGGVLPAALLAESGDRRVSARVILVDRDGAVLLVHGHDPRNTGDRFWFTPGGGVEPGEELAAAALREVREETGLELSPGSLLGPLYRREAVFAFDGDVMDSDEYFFAATVDRFDPRPAGLTDVELHTIDEMRWCQPDDVTGLADPVYPQALPGLVADVRAALAAGGVPAGAPIAID